MAVGVSVVGFLALELLVLKDSMGRSSRYWICRGWGNWFRRRWMLRWTFAMLLQINLESNYVG